MIEIGNKIVPSPVRDLPHGWQKVRLGDICVINPRRAEKLVRSDEAVTTFIPMPAVDAQQGVIARPELKPYLQVRKGYTFFIEGDVLFAKITPCMQNGKHAIARNLTDGIGFGSTEFHVLRPSDGITADWVHHFIRQPWVLHAATAHFTGAVGQQRVPEAFLASLQIPLPPLAEQQRIAAILAEQTAAVDRARAAAGAQLNAANELPAAYLRVTFDNPEARQGLRVRLGQVLRLRKEVVHPQDKPEGPATFVGLEHIEPGTGLRSGAVDLEMSQLTGRKPRFYKGDIVYGYLRPYLNKVWIADFDGLCSVDQYVYEVDPFQASNQFIAWFMRSPVYLQIAPIDQTPGQLPRIRTEEVASVELNLPPLSQQEHTVAMLSRQMESLQQAHNALIGQLAAINKLPSALLRRAFNGEL